MSTRAIGMRHRTYEVPQKPQPPTPESLHRSAWADIGQSDGSKVWALCVVCHELVPEDVALAIPPNVGLGGFHHHHRLMELGDPGLSNESWFLRLESDIHGILLQETPEDAEDEEYGPGGDTDDAAPSKVYVVPESEARRFSPGMSPTWGLVILLSILGALVLYAGTQLLGSLVGLS